MPEPRRSTRRILFRRVTSTVGLQQRDRLKKTRRPEAPRARPAWILHLGCGIRGVAPQRDRASCDPFRNRTWDLSKGVRSWVIQLYDRLALWIQRFVFIPVVEGEPVAFLRCRTAVPKPSTTASGIGNIGLSMVDISVN
jgi:hypothetical protein